MKKDDRYEALRNLIKKDPESDGNLAENETYRFTPKGILYMALYETYGSRVREKDLQDIDKFNAFVKKALNALSCLATNNMQSNLFGEDFNQFFSMCVNAINLCAKMHKILEDHGIDVDFSDLENGQEDD